MLRCGAYLLHCRHAAADAAGVHVASRTNSSYTPGADTGVVEMRVEGAKRPKHAQPAYKYASSENHRMSAQIPAGRPQSPQLWGTASSTSLRHTGKPVGVQRPPQTVA